MYKARLLAPAHVDHAIYHCVSRVVNRDKVFGREEKEYFVKLMRLYEQLYGLQIITFCIMSNHFHILVEVPKRPKELPNNEALIALIRETLGGEVADRLAGWFDCWAKQNNLEAIEAERERWFRQMWDLGQFMKMLKQRFSVWFNRRQPSRRTGTLWEERYSSELVQDGPSLHTMAAYIDLNPVRAGLVDDPKDYRWGGYGEACAGQSLACRGLLRAAQAADPTRGTVTDDLRTATFDTLAWYREQLFGRGGATHNAEGLRVRRGFTEEEMEAVRDARGLLPTHVYLHLRVRYFTDGLVLGTAAFVEDILRARPDLFSVKRRTAARRLKGLDWNSPLRVARALVVKPFGK